MKRGKTVRKRTARQEPAPLRVVIEDIRPRIDHGQYPVKRTIGEPVEVSADIFADGHDVVRALVLYRKEGETVWQEMPMEPSGNDRFRGTFPVKELGRYEYTVESWSDRFDSLLQDLKKKVDAQQDVQSELLECAALVKQAAGRASARDSQWLIQQANAIGKSGNQKARIEAAQSHALAMKMSEYPDRHRAFRNDPSLIIEVERESARFGSWYEIFPRSCTSRPDRHGSFRDLEKRLPYIASMGFDVLYLPPIHPIGGMHRKGRNNALKATAQDPGSPWAIGSKEGGHKAVHQQLGTITDFDHLVSASQKKNLEIALDLAFQCSPDHPYVREHPEWFRHRPDGTIKYAENPPKKYQDIYPFDFECERWKELYEELKSIVTFWIEHGVRIFRVDNPHTKTFRFWEWMIREVKKEYPDTIFLAEAFTRPKVMRYLAKIGFSQSYTYFTWRNTKKELTEYFTELTQSDVTDTMRPNLFVNTPDILHETLQFGGRAAFMGRLVLAATLGASYGIYGPAFELCEPRAVSGTEEYLDSEKYQIRVWDLNSKDNLRHFIARVNRIRKENAALQFNAPLHFHPVDNEKILCYTKSTADSSNIVLIVVNLDPHHKQSGRITLPADEFHLPETRQYQVHDLLGDARYLWEGSVNYVELDPAISPAHIFRLRRKIKTERDFDYFF